jgi:hypothetical protein
VRYADDDDSTPFVVDLVDDPPVSDPHPIVAASGELRAAVRPRLGGETVDLVVHSSAMSPESLR